MATRGVEYYSTLESDLSVSIPLLGSYRYVDS